MNEKFYVPQDEFWKKFDETIRCIFHETEMRTNIVFLWIFGKSYNS